MVKFSTVVEIAHLDAILNYHNSSVLSNKGCHHELGEDSYFLGLFFKYSKFVGKLSGIRVNFKGLQKFRDFYVIICWLVGDSKFKEYIWEFVVASLKSELIILAL